MNQPLEKIYTKHQENILQKIELKSDVNKWKDWKWQVKNSVRTIEAFEHLTGIRFSEDEKQTLKVTQSKFPLSITPYYLSLIKKDNFRQV